jgi:heme-degrading monooxygenase HmoA
MIKVITGYKLNEGHDVQSTLFKLRSHAMTFAGYIGSENLVGEKDNLIVAQIMTWDTMTHWREWEKSTIRLALMREIRPALEEEPRITTYRVMPASGWNYAPRGS